MFAPKQKKTNMSAGRYPYVLTKHGRDQHFNLTNAQRFEPTTRDGVVFWAIAHTLGPWVILPRDIPYDAVLAVSRKSLINGQKVMMNVAGVDEMEYVVRQSDLMLAIALSNAAYFDTPHSLLSSVTCSIRGCTSPVELKFDETTVCEMLDLGDVDSQTKQFLRKLFKGKRWGERVVLSTIDHLLERIIDRSQHTELAMAVVGRILEASALPSRRAGCQ